MCTFGRFFRFEATLFVVLMFFGEYAFTSATAEAPQAHSKACRGATSLSLEHGDSPKDRFERYRKQYRNCTKVKGALIISFLDGDDDYDMSFLKDVREVVDFVLIQGNHFSYLNLSSLRIIRGKRLFNRSSSFYSLFIANNYKIGSTAVGLKELGLVSLQEILAGSVYFYNNKLLCHEETIDWEDIMSNNEKPVFSNATSLDHRECSSCDANCVNGSCWDEGPGMCQTMHKKSCSQQCDSQCYGPNPNECCHPECAGGCYGPKKTNCFSCRKFIDEGMCVEQCPPVEIYSTSDYKHYPNPDGKYADGDECVKNCPVHLIADRGACVIECSEGYFADESRKCVKCDGPCPKTCPGTGTDFLNSVNIHRFAGCTIINGNLRILPNSFSGDSTYNISGITVDQLSVFESLQEITDYLTIQGSPAQLTNLSFLRSLVTIQGRNLEGAPAGRPFLVHSTSLQFLGLHSLKKINNGKPLILSNKDLCYVSSVNWSSIVTSGSGANLKGNKNETICEEEGKNCSALCLSGDGCWGHGDDQCLRCSGYSVEKLCVAACNEVGGWFTYEQNGTKECRRCHKECFASCTGENADQCDSCKHQKDGPYCVETCPSVKYPDAKNVCQPCHENCRGGCTGSENTVGDGACNDCAIVVYDGQPVVYDGQPPKAVHCRQAESGCGSGFYSRYTSSPNSRTEKHEGCYRCHPECTVCMGYDISFCSPLSCVNFIEGERCVSNCSQGFYADKLLRSCHMCDSQCLRCVGPTPNDCVACRNLKVYNDTENRVTNSLFTCVEDCPGSHPAKLTDSYNGMKETICVTDAFFEKSVNGDSKKKQVGIIVGLIAGIVLIGVIIIVIFCIKRQMTRSEENKLRWAAKLNGLDEFEPLNPTKAGPDMSMLRLINESELQRENVIGSGAFGTVYKGAWKPEENVKIPVAIKVLQNPSSGQNKELLNEARIMASVDHHCCVRIIAVCMTAQMMLVTQLMPLGCLLEYIRKNQQNIGSKTLLNWSAQIAKGMNYLESLGIVHRDLAARNVLVHSPNLVKVTDFGLAKLLDVDQNQLQSDGEKMPIKWLALECIMHRLYTHKSDVWSYGITMWELYTYGQRPYENVTARDIPKLLQTGERLPQPVICTIDVYMIMVKCWMIDASSRPSFQELASEYAKMARDPGRYLLIKGDNLMKLPDVKYKPEDLLDETDGPEQIMSADDYLKPQQLSHAGSKHNRDYQNVDPTLANTTEKKSVGLESVPALKKNDFNSIRYSSDPCKIIDPEVSVDNDQAAPNRDSTDGQRQVPSSLDVSVKLPLDGDNYLQPSATSPAAYLEMIDEDTDDVFDSSSAQAAVSNPEYFDDNDAAFISANTTIQNRRENSNFNPDAQAQKPNSGFEAERQSIRPVVKMGGQIDSRPYNESEV